MKLLMALLMIAAFLISSACVAGDNTALLPPGLPIRPRTVLPPLNRPRRAADFTDGTRQLRFLPERSVGEALGASQSFQRRLEPSRLKNTSDLSRSANEMFK